VGKKRAGLGHEKAAQMPVDAAQRVRSRLFERGNYPMKIDVQILGHGTVPDAAMAQYTVTTHFDGPLEAMTMSVVISNTGDEASRKMQAVARAKELARLFYEQEQA
jgi:hypothetical protein